MNRELLDQAERRALATPTVEICGAFFYPLELEKTPAFLPMRNHHPQPDHHFEFYGADLEDAIQAFYGTYPKGRIQSVHSHLFAEEPSADDIAMIVKWTREMEGDEWWSLTTNHLCYVLSTRSWFEYDEDGMIGRLADVFAPGAGC